MDLDREESVFRRLNEKMPLDENRSWNAQFRGHDWARMMNYYFVVHIYSNEGDRSINVELPDTTHLYVRDAHAFTEEEEFQGIKTALAKLALAGR